MRARISSLSLSFLLSLFCFRATTNKRMDFRRLWWTSICAAPSDEARRLDALLVGARPFPAGAARPRRSAARAPLEETQDVRRDHARQPRHLLLRR